MAQTKRSKAKKTNRIWILALVILLAAAAGGYYLWNRNQQISAAAADVTPSLRTATVRRGNISLSATGSGTLTASKTSSLSFPTSGTVAKVNVQVGDQVKQGQVLAQLANSDQLQAAVESAQQD